MRLFFGLTLALVGFGSSLALEMQDGTCKPGSSNYLDANPLGTCVCDGHLYVSEDCREGFFCTDTTGHGCYKQCPEGEFLVTDIGRQTWTCLKNGIETIEGFFTANTTSVPTGFEGGDDKILKQCPIGGFNLCPSTSGTQAPVPDESQVTSNPLGTCRCNGELWISEGCSYGFVCDDQEAIGGILKTCPPGQIVLIDWETNTWDCSDKTNYCPGAQINGVGCKQPNCEMGHNEMGYCTCDGQFFINDDCTEGFLCTTNIPDPYLYDGCVKKCLNGQVLVADFGEENWICVDREEYPRYKCPGAFNLECPGTNFPEGDFTDQDCDCNGQILVNADCSEAFYCLSKFLGGGRALRCDPGFVLEVDLLEYKWGCVKDSGKCPGLAGFKAGCEGNEMPPLDLRCDFGENTIGECQCPGQVFINEDCSKSFYCTAETTDGLPGCHKECGPGEIVEIDKVNHEWKCTKRPIDFMCPGKFSIDCPGHQDFDIKCNCAGEMWVNSACDTAFRCDAPFDGKANSGKFQTCKPGTILDFDLTKPPGEYECTEEVAKCPGSFHFGCEGGDFQTDSSSGVFASLALVLACLVFRL